MDEMLETSGVDEVSAAETQTEEVSGVETQVAAEPEKQNNFEKAFAKRLAEAQAKWEQGVADKYADYDKIKQESAYLDKRARQEGFSDVQAYLRAIDDLERQRLIERESERLGVDPDIYAQHFAPVTQEVQQLRQELNTYKAQIGEKQLQDQLQSQWAALYNSYPHLRDEAKAWEKDETPSFYTEQMQTYLAKGYEPIDAYELAHKATLFRAKEQEVLARVTGRDQRQILPSTDQPNNLQFDPANMSDKDILEISRRVQNGERITF